MAKRKPPTLRDKLASVLLTMVRPSGMAFVPVIPTAKAAKMSSDEILAAFDWHHVFPVALGGDNRPLNLRPMLRAEHQERFALDMGEIARVRRGLKKRAGQKRRSRPMPGSKASPWKRRMDGTVERRT